MSSITVSDILFSNTHCTSGNELVGVHRSVTAAFSFVILVVAVFTTLLVYLKLGKWTALVWFTVPIGAISYLKARFGPLQVKATKPASSTEPRL